MDKHSKKFVPPPRPMDEMDLFLMKLQEDGFFDKKLAPEPRRKQSLIRAGLGLIGTHNWLQAQVDEALSQCSKPRRALRMM